MLSNKLYNNYSSMDDEEKFAMRYGASGRSLGDVVRYSPKDIKDPNKVFNAWVKGEDMRKAGTSKDFLDELEKIEMAELEKTILRNNKPTNSYPIKTAVNAVTKTSFNNKLLSNDKNSDIMDVEKFSYAKTTGASDYATKSGTGRSKTHVTYGCPDVNVVGGIQLRLNELGYTDVDITGTFDASTEAAIKEFQEERELPVTGVLDDATKAEMGFSDDYSVSRKGKNATPWHAPYSPPFNMEDYKREQEAEKASEEEESSPHSFLANVIAGFLYNHGGAQPFSPEAEIIYDEYQKNIENDLNELSERHGEQMIYNYMGE